MDDSVRMRSNENLDEIEDPRMFRHSMKSFENVNCNRAMVEHAAFRVVVK